jgi:hypothetical protein
MIWSYLRKPLGYLCLGGSVILLMCGAYVCGH